MEFAEYLVTQDEQEKEIKELISELESMTLEDFKLSDYTYLDSFIDIDVCISFCYHQSCYAFVELDQDPDDPSDLWDDDTYDEEFTELKAEAIEALKEEL